MSEPQIRRIVVACDAACDIRVAVEDAAALAERWNAALHGVFLEDENLYRLAALPFARQAMLSSEVAATLDTAEIEKHAAAQGAAMRRALAEAASRRGLEWSFGSLRDIATVGALDEIEGDMLIVQATPRPFSGSWAPRSTWNALPEEYNRPILIRRLPRIGYGTIVIVLNGTDPSERVLFSGFAMASPKNDVVILLQDGSQRETEAAKRLAESARAGQPRTLRLETIATDSATLLQRIAQLQPALVVIDVTAGNDVLDATRCDVLLVR